MSKLKIGIIGVVVVAVFAAVLAIQNQSLARLREENQALRQQADQVSPLQAENQRLSNAVANAGTAPGQDSPVRELARLRAEVGTLRESVTRLRQQNGQIAKLQQENQQLQSDVTAMAAAKRAQPPPMDPAIVAQNACVNNLRLIDSAKQQWALEHQKQAADTPAWSDLQPYIGRGTNGELPACPSGGTYVIGAVGEKPQCNVATHVLP
jgi:cell division protein FtsB